MISEGDSTAPTALKKCPEGYDSKVWEELPADVQEDILHEKQLKISNPTDPSPTNESKFHSVNHICGAAGG